MGDVKQSDIRALIRRRLSYDESRDRLLLVKAARRFPQHFASCSARA
jgi:hypothetical protein